MLNPNYILGFVDGEGTFHIAIYKDSRMKQGIKIIPEFHVSQQNSSIKVLNELVKFFDCGYVKENHPKNVRDKTCVYVVRKRDDLITKIIPFFEKYQLQTEKQKSFVTFAKIVRLMENNQHSFKTGIQKILKLAYSMNQQGKYRRKKITL